jgi:hypothetical protein
VDSVKSQVGDVRLMADGLVEKAGEGTDTSVVLQPVSDLDSRHKDLAQLVQGLLIDLEKGAESLTHCQVTS